MTIAALTVLLDSGLIRWRGLLLGVCIMSAIALPQGWSVVDQDGVCHQSDSLGLRGLWGVIKPKYKAAKATIAEYQTAVNLWGDFWDRASVMATEALSPEPAIEGITRAHLQAWRDWMDDGSRLPVTINKRVTAVISLVRMAEEDGLVDRLPRSPKPLEAESNQRKIIIRSCDVAAMYQAAHQATWPAEQPAAVWQALIVCLWHYGARVGDFIDSGRRKNPLLWQTDDRDCGVSFNPQSPTSDATNDHGWLWYESKKTSRLVVLPMNRVVAAHLRRLQRSTVDPRVWQFPLYRPGYERQRDKILGAATPSLRAGNGRSHFVLEDFRHTAVTWHRSRRPELQPWITGHATGSVIDDHYFVADFALAEYFAELPYPAAFDAVFDTGQKTIQFSWR